MNKILIVALCASLAAACGPAPAPRAAAQPQAGDHGHDHAPGAEKLTHYSAHTELFVEFPRLAVGEVSPFAAHLTRLADFAPLAAGTVTVVLTGGAAAEERFASDTPSQPGIFRPEARPRHGGRRALAIEVATPAFRVRHDLGEVEVYPDRKAADAAPPAAEAEGIGFTKEQQWQLDFATAEVAARPLREVVAAQGVLRARPDGEAQLTAPTAGRIQPAGRFPRLGQTVRRGELLAYLVPRLGGSTDIASLEAAAAKAQVESDQARRERGRLEALFRDEAVAERRVFEARAAELSAAAELEAARRRLGQYGGAGGGVPIRAPLAGTLADVRVAPGAFADEGALLFHIAERSHLWLELRVPESDAARLAAPAGAAFAAEGIETAFEIVAGRNGRLVAVGGVVDAVTRTVPVVFEFDAPDPRLRLGMAVRGQVFAGPPREALAVPAGALLDEAGLTTVFVQTGGESFERRPLRLGVRQGDWVEVREGLRQGERVVTRGAYLVKLAASGTGQIGHGHAH